MNWYKIAQSEVVTPQDDRSLRKEDVLTVLNSASTPLSSKDIMIKLFHSFPQRWTLYYALTRIMAQHIQNAIRDIQNSGISMQIKDEYNMPRAKRGGMGKAQHYNTYQIIK